jgi:hypothetical protein
VEVIKHIADKRNFSAYVEELILRDIHKEENLIKKISNLLQSKNIVVEENDLADSINSILDF